MADAPFTDNYRFTGPRTAISCEVEYDADQERWIARGDGGSIGWTGFGHDATSAALNCFRAWMLDEGGYHESMPSRSSTEGTQDA